MSLPKQPGALLGVDVGFSVGRKTTGLAWRVNGVVGTSLSGSTWTSRSAARPPDIVFDIAARDAPLVPTTDKTPRRSCEAAFYRGEFWNRCRPGMSHHGRGLGFRNAGREAATQFSTVVRPGATVRGGAIPEIPIVEAFPNTFLGVLLPLDAFLGAGKFVKGQRRSDWLYDACVTNGVFRGLVEHLGWSEPGTLEHIVQEPGHDLRAALVCLLTAGFAAAGTASVVGDDEGGWFCLPPLKLWAPWARAAVDLTMTQARTRGYPNLVMHG